MKDFMKQGHHDSRSEIVADAGRHLLASAQLGVWFDQARNPHLTGYNTGEFLELTGPLDRAVLKQAWDRLVREVSALRLYFRERDGEPWQAVAPRVDMDMPLVDLSSEPDPVAASHVWARAVLEEPFDLSCAPLYRVSLLRLGATWHRLALISHHLIIDGLSYRLIYQRLGELYAAIAQGRQPAPAEDNDFLKTLEGDLAYRASADYARDREFWLSYLEGRPTPLDLSGRPLVLKPVARQEMAARQMPAEVMARLRGLSGAANPRTLLAALACYAHRLTGMAEVPLLWVTANRNTPQERRCPGVFLGGMPLRLGVEPGDRLADVVARLNDQLSVCRPHGRYPLHDLLRDLNLTAQGLAGLAGLLFNFVPTPTNLDFGGLRASIVGISTGGVYALSFTPVGEMLTGGVDMRLLYNPDLFGGDEVALHLERFTRLLETLPGQDRLGAGGLDVLLPEERRSLLEQWGVGGPDVEPATLAQLFERQVAATPQAEAIIFEDQRLTYAQLEARANRLARRLVARGVGPEIVVAICMERAVELMIAILAVTKAGGAWLCLDPAYPPDRLSFMFADAQAALLLTLGEAASALPEATAVLRLDDAAEMEIVAGLSGEPLQDEERLGALSVANLANLVYTSGSTGRPKGAMLTHHGLANLRELQLKWMQLGPGARVLQFASPSFDAMLFEFLAALTSGAALVMAKASRLMPGPGLVSLAREAGVTHAVLIPSTLAALDPRDFHGLKVLLTAGEACPASIADAWGEGRRFLVAYGPTEGTVAASLDQRFPGHGAPPLGQPIPGGRLYVLNEALEPVGIGVVGEVYIGGVCLARGYRARPGLTAERFVPDPFGPPGGRLYRTGDRALWRVDRELEFVGRADNQIKLRGYRIELGEIEGVLMGHPGVSRAAVIVSGGGGADARLVAYLSPPQGASAPEESQLRAWLAQRLPAFMVPNTFVALDSMPLNPNGKVDRQALPAPPAGKEALDSRPPRTPEEQALADIWRGLFALEGVEIGRAHV
jgi:nonribosomal peptide synthetase DhbF